MARPQNSTNVRPDGTLPARVAVVLGTRRLALRALAKVSPAAAAAYAFRLFATPRRHPRPAREAEALAGARRARVSYDGHDLPVWTWGREDAPAALLVHGWEGRGAQLAAFVPALLDLGLRVVAFDAPGHGEAEAPRETLVDHARAVQTVAAQVGDVRLVVAHSMGAAATLLATRFGLRARAYALVAPPTSPAPWLEGFARAYRLGDELRRDLRSVVERRVGIPFADLDARLDAHALEAPLLVVHDEEDLEVRIEEGREIADAARDARLVVTRGLGHRRVLRAPEVVREVEAFAAAFAAPRAGGTSPSPGAPARWTCSAAAALDAELFFREERWATA